MFCNECGSKIYKGEKYCGSCGVKTKDEKEVPLKKMGEESGGPIILPATKNLYSEKERNNLSKGSGFNPRLVDFIDKYEELTLIGVAWACWWRLVVSIYGVIFGIAILITIIAVILE